MGNESETFPFQKEEAEDLEDCWGLVSFHAPASVVEGIRFEENPIENNNKVTEKDAAEIDSIYNMDIVQFALGESGLDEFLSEEQAQDSKLVKAFSVISMQEESAFQPVATTASFIDPTDTFITLELDPTAISLLLPSSKPDTVVSKQSKPVMKRKAGRPERQTPLEITEVPKKGSVSLTPDQMRSLKYRRSRGPEVQRCRKSRKEKQNMKGQECEELEEKNRMLTEQILAKEAEVVAWRARCRAIGYHGLV